MKQLLITAAGIGIYTFVLMPLLPDMPSTGRRFLLLSVIYTPLLMLIALLHARGRESGLSDPEV